MNLGSLVIRFITAHAEILGRKNKIVAIEISVLYKKRKTMAVKEEKPVEFFFLIY